MKMICGNCSHESVCGFKKIFEKYCKAIEDHRDSFSDEYVIDFIKPVEPICMYWQNKQSTLR